MSAFPVLDASGIQLANDLWCNVVAFSLRVPGDAKPPAWRHVESLEPVSTQLLLTPVELLDWKTTEISPIIDLLIWMNNPKQQSYELYRSYAYDDRTRLQINHWSHHWLEDGFEINRDGDWLRIGVPIGTWHDTPVRMMLDWDLDPLEELKWAEPSAFSNWERRVEPFYHDENDLPKYDDFRKLGSQADWWYEPMPLWNPRTYYSISNVFGDQEDVTEFGWDRLYPPYLGNPPTEPWNPVTLQLSGIPDMPNDRDLDNLFEARIPLVTTGNPIAVVMGATESRSSRHTIDVVEIKTYRNMMAHEIFSQRSCIEPYPNFEMNGNRLEINSLNPPWWVEMKNWWDDHAPHWLR